MTALADPKARDAATIILAAATAARQGHRYADTVAAYTDGRGGVSIHGGPVLSASDMAVGAAAVLDRVMGDVAALLDISPDRSLALTALWVQQQVQGD